MEWLVGIALAVVLFVFGIRTDVWGLFQEPSITVLASSALSVVVIIATERLAASLRDRTHLEKVSKLIEAQTAQIARYNLIRQFTTSDEAMQYLCKRIPEATVVLNTKISKQGIPPDRTVGQQYEEAIVNGLKLGLVYKEVVSPVFKDYVERLLKNSAGTKGRYEHTFADVNSPSFLNFIVMEFPDGEEEVIIGWATSAAFGTEQKAYKILDNRVTSYFRTYHGSLWG